MRKAFAVVIPVFIFCTVARAQQPPQEQPTQDQHVQLDRSGPTPVFRLTVVERTTQAINYRHRSGSTPVGLRGTSLMPEAKGEAIVNSKQGRIEIDATMEHMPAATQYGPEYLTYVLWAVTPGGRPKNLGEVLLSGEKSKLDVTTDLQTFGLIVTAEPYFAVTQPSDVVVMEDFVRNDTQGTYENIDAKYELLQRGQYVLNVNPSDIKPFSMDRKVPLEFYEAENAVRIARWTGADRYAAETLQKAELGVQNAQEELSGKIGKKTVAQNSRDAAQNAEDARLIAIRKMQDEADAQAKAEVERRNAETQAEADEAKRGKAEADAAAAQAQAEAERVKTQAEADAEQAAQEKAAALAQAQAEADQRDAQTRAQAEEAQRAKAESEQNAAQAQAEAERVKSQAEANAEQAAQDKAAAEEAAAEADRLRRQAQADAEQASQEKAAAMAQVQESQEQLAQARQQAEQAEQEKAQLRDQIRQQLNVILVTRETARGLIVNMSDVLFDSGKYTLKPGAREKLAKVSGIILAHPGLNLEIEGHTDSVGSDEYNQRLSEKRANSVRDYLVAQGLPADSVTAKGLGKTAPVTTNDTPVGRQQNRRVEMVVSGEPIGVAVGNNVAGRDQSYSQR